MAAAPER